MRSTWKSKAIVLATVFVAICKASSLAAEPLAAFQNATLVDAEFNDGDSFLVRLKRDDKPVEEVVRLYYVDCPETSFGAESDLRRIGEQARYFGLEDERRQVVIDFGKEAGKFVEDHLAKPFTIYTAFARAQGRSKKPRIYAMIETSEGEDLAKLLVENGLARAFGVGRQLPNGTPSSEYKIFLEDLEMVAGLKKTGIWSATNPEKIADLRKQQRDEDQELKVGLAFGVFSTISEDDPLDLNSATAEELQQLNGIGPELAERIVAAQPFAAVADLVRVRGIGEVTLEKIAPFLKVSGGNP